MRHPNSLEEANQFGYTAVHLALNQPLCLRMILKASKPSMIDTFDVHGLTLFDYASTLGCRTATQILLSFGCRIELGWLSRCHESCVDDVLSDLKRRRDDLKRLALESLMETEAKSLGLYESTVLDRKAFRVQQPATTTEQGGEHPFSSTRM